MQRLAGALGMACVLTLAAGGCAPREARPYPVEFPVSTGPGITSAGVPARVGAPMGPPYQVGLATWYGESFAGKKTSNGERF